MLFKCKCAHGLYLIVQMCTWSDNDDLSHKANSGNTILDRCALDL